jgi:hypothetical protein
MITPKDRDMNRSRDVKGPELERSYDEEKTNMKGMKTDLMHDDHPTGTIEKTPLSDLHFGDEERPLVATGQQQVVVSHPMGSDMPDHVPSLAKGSDRAGSAGHAELSKSSGGTGTRNPKGMGRSVAKELEYAEKRKK